MKKHTTLKINLRIFFTFFSVFFVFFSFMSVIANEGPELPLSTIKKLQNQNSDTNVAFDLNDYQHNTDDSFHSIHSDDNTNHSNSLDQSTTPQEAFESDPFSSEQELMNALDQKKIRTKMLLDRIQAELYNSREQLSSINQNMIDTREKLKSIKRDEITLRTQIKIFDQQIQDTEKLLENVKNQIFQKKAEITELEHQMTVTDIYLRRQQKMFTDFLDLLYKKQNDFMSLSPNGTDLNTLKLLFGDESAGDTLLSLKYTEIFEDQGRVIINQLSGLLEEQAAEEQLLQLMKKTLTLLELTHEENLLELHDKQRGKKALLEETKGQEKLFRELLDASTRQHQESEYEVQYFSQSLISISERINEMGASFNPDEFAFLFDNLSSFRVFRYLTESRIDRKFEPIWPIVPKRGISAHFQDQSYLNYFGFPHKAIDIPAPQASLILSAEDGVVYRVKDNGYGYSYLMIAHQDGFMTLYGHIFNFLVSEGDTVSRGDVVALSGGAPGTKGAGVYTTGSHLHFEIIKDGIHVDPLLFLNLAELNRSSLPSKYHAKAIDDEFKAIAKAQLNKYNNSTDDLISTKTKVRRPENNINAEILDTENDMVIAID